MLSRIRSLAGSTIDTLESSFQKRHQAPWRSCERPSFLSFRVTTTTSKPTCLRRRLQHTQLGTEISRLLIPACGDIDSCAGAPSQSNTPISHWTAGRFCNGCPDGARAARVGFSEFWYKLACFLNSLRPSLIRVVRRKKIERMKRKIGIAAARKAMILKIILSVLLRPLLPVSR